MVKHKKKPAAPEKILVQAIVEEDLRQWVLDRARAEGLSASSYVRRLIIQDRERHLTAFLKRR